MQKRIWIFVYLLFLSGQVAWGIPYSTGNYMVDVEVYNSASNIISKAHVSVWVENKAIQIKASATGYVSKKLAIATNGDSGYFKRDIFLPDIEKKFCAIDVNNKPLNSVYFQMGQYGFEPSEYGIIAFIPKVAWPNPSRKKVNILDRVLGFSMMSKCTIEEVDAFYKVTMTIGRGTLEFAGPDLFVIFDTSKPVPAERIHTMLNDIARIETSPGKYPPGASMGLATFFANVIPRSDVMSAANGVLPETLKALYDLQDRFLTLHHEKES